MGLAIAERTARLLGHQIALSSVPGKGSAFSVEVPLAQAVPPPKGAPASPEAADALPAGTLLIVIDDEPDVLTALTMLLEAVGYEVLAADSGEQAAAALAECGRRPGAILADYRLGGGKLGTDAIRLVQKAAGAPVPGIIITGDTSPDRIRESRASGFTLLHKPVRSARLKEVLTKVLKPAARPA